MFKPRGISQTIGVILFLVFVYLVLDKAGGARNLLTALFSGGGSLVKILQGR